MRTWPPYLLLAALTVGACALCNAAETDQFLVWDKELKDSSEAFNRYLNEEVERFLKRVNRRKKPVEDGVELTTEFYLSMFQGLHYSRVRNYLNYSEEVERFPDRSVSVFEHQRMSIFRKLRTFPFLLPMARTIRLGDVYLGVDKVGHMLGYGRRYYQRYQRSLAEGLSEEEALERTIRWGIWQEASVVGTQSDGVFSHGDLESDYQGFLMALDCWGGDDPLFERVEGKWRARRKLDILKYITPGFDESYNTSHYSRFRWPHVAPFLKKYCEMRNEPLVQARFARYREIEELSYSQLLIKKHFAEKGKDLQRAHSLETICSESDGAMDQGEAR